MNDIRIKKIDNGFIIQYWNSNNHEVYCATMEDVMAAITVAVKTPSAVPQLGGALAMPNASVGQMSVNPGATPQTNG
jgi:hypothetical protein